MIGLRDGGGEVTSLSSTIMNLRKGRVSLSDEYIMVFRKLRASSHGQ